MSKLNALTGGYKEGSERTSIPESIPPKRNLVFEILFQIKEYYIGNSIGDDDVLFLIDCVRYLGDNVHKPQTNIYNINPQPTERLSTFIENNYKTKKLDLNGLGELTQGLNNILLNTSQKDKIKSSPPKEESKSNFNLKTLSNYREGSPRTKSDNQYKPTKGTPPKQIDPTYIVDSLKTFKAGGNLTEDSIKKIISELNKLV